MIDITVSNKQMKPQVIHTDQFENGVHVIRFTIDNYMQNDVDLRKFDAYVVTSINGEMDMTILTPPTISGRSLIFTWSLSSHTLKNPGVIQYQLVLSKSAEDGNVVWNSYKGVIINRLSINADDYMSANYPTLMKQWLDLMHTLSGAFGAPITYMQPGNSIPVEERLANRMYYQWEETPNFRATCATGMVKLGKRPYADSGLYINNTHICVDTTNETAYVIDPAIWVNTINNADCGVIATDISDSSGIILHISAKNAGANGNSIGLKLDVATYGAGAGERNPSGGDVIAMSGGYDSTVGVDDPKGHFEDAHGNILRSASKPDYSAPVSLSNGTINNFPTDAIGYIENTSAWATPTAIVDGKKVYMCQVGKDGEGVCGGSFLIPKGCTLQISGANSNGYYVPLRVVIN